MAGQPCSTISAQVSLGILFSRPESDGRRTPVGTLFERGAGRSQVIVSRAVARIVHELRVGAHISGWLVAVLQIPIGGAVLVYEIVEVDVVCSGFAVLFNSESASHGI